MKLVIIVKGRGLYCSYNIPYQGSSPSLEAIECEKNTKPGGAATDEARQALTSENEMKRNVSWGHRKRMRHVAYLEARPRLELTTKRNATLVV
jgi:hypothetical protein